MSLKPHTTIKEIAAALNVSISTVSRALQEDPRIGLRTRMRVLEMAKALQYKPNQAAVQLRKGRTMTIGVLIPWLKEEFFSMALTGIEDVLNNHKFHALISQSRDEEIRECLAVKSFLAAGVDGVIVSLSAGTQQSEHFIELEAAGVPIVYFDRIPDDRPCNAVRSNVVKGVSQAVDFLLRQDRTRIAMITGPATLGAAKERLDLFQSIAKEHEMEVQENMLRYTNLQAADTKAQMAALLDLSERPQAVFAFNDYVALDAMQACKQAGLVPNQDIAFVSFANLPITSYMDNPPLASIEQFAYEMGEKAAQLLLNIQNQANDSWQEIMVDTQLVIH